MDFIYPFNAFLAVVAMIFASWDFWRANRVYRWMKLVIAVDAGFIFTAYLLYMALGPEWGWALDVADTWVLATFIASLFIGHARGYHK